MELTELTERIAVKERWGAPARVVRSLQYDSRKVGPADVFFALRGTQVDGHRFTGQALQAQAGVIVAEESPKDDVGEATWLKVPDAREAMGAMAAAFHRDPSRSLKVAGVTGTNGKTTTTFLIQHLMQAALRRCGLIGTVFYDTGSKVVTATHTTPESCEVHALLAGMLEAGCQAAVMEVSSHGLEQRRTAGVEFDAAVFTNLSQDHLDYHGTMENYFQAKRRLFEGIKLQEANPDATAVVNGDDSYGLRLAREARNALTFGFGARCDYRAENYRCGFEGAQFQLSVKGRQLLVRTPLIGRFNVYNALAALASAVSMGANLREAVANLREAPQVPGRMESVGNTTAFRVFVDYAHTPDALEKACATLRELQPKRLVTVFGCGGVRDRGKRPLMAESASRLSDVVILTSDNPRTEDPEQILSDTEKGLGSTPYQKIPDRREAIAAAIDGAEEKDVILIAGKGHEDYQIVGTEKRDFDDRLVAQHCLNDRRNRT